MTPAGDPDPTLPTSHPAPQLVTHQEGQLPCCYGDSRLQGPGGGEGPATAAAALEARVEKGSQNLGPSGSREPQWTTKGGQTKKRHVPDGASGQHLTVDHTAYLGKEA